MGEPLPSQRSRASAGTKPVEDIVHLRAGKPAPNIEFILCLLQQLLPHVARDDDALRTAMRAEVHRVPFAAVESLGDLMERVPGLPRWSRYGNPYGLGDGRNVRARFGGRSPARDWSRSSFCRSRGLRQQPRRSHAARQPARAGPDRSAAGPMGSQRSSPGAAQANAKSFSRPATSLAQTRSWASRHMAWPGSASDPPKGTSRWRQPAGRTAVVMLTP